MLNIIIVLNVYAQHCREGMWLSNKQWPLITSNKRLCEDHSAGIGWIKCQEYQAVGFKFSLHRRLKEFFLKHALPNKNILSVNDFTYTSTDINWKS